jgi:hypothetical protein
MESIVSQICTYTTTQLMESQGARLFIPSLPICCSRLSQGASLVSLSPFAFQVVSEPALSLTADSLFVDGAILRNFRPGMVAPGGARRRLLQNTGDGATAYSFDVRMLVKTLATSSGDYGYAWSSVG